MGATPPPPSGREHPEGLPIPPRLWKTLWITPPHLWKTLWKTIEVVENPVENFMET